MFQPRVLLEGGPCCSRLCVQVFDIARHVGDAQQNLSEGCICPEKFSQLDQGHGACREQGGAKSQGPSAKILLGAFAEELFVSGKHL